MPFKKKFGVFVLQAGVLGTYNSSLGATQRAMESAFGNPSQFGGVGALPALGGVVQAAGIVDPRYGYDGYNSNPFNQGPQMPQMPQMGGGNIMGMVISFMMQRQEAREAREQQAMARQMQMQQQMAAFLMFAKFSGMDVSGMEDMFKGIQRPSGSSEGSDGKFQNIPGSGGVEKAANLIAKFESFRDTAYRDRNGYAVGFGSRTIDGKTVQKGQTITREKATQALQQRIREDERKLDAWVHVPLNENQKAALLSFMYNAGSGAIQQDGIVALLNKGDYEGAARKLEVARRTSNGVFLDGLAKRRKQEANLFRSGSAVATDNGGKQPKQKPSNPQMPYI